MFPSFDIRKRQVIGFFFVLFFCYLLYINLAVPIYIAELVNASEYEWLTKCFPLHVCTLLFYESTEFSTTYGSLKGLLDGLKFLKRFSNKYVRCDQLLLLASRVERNDNEAGKGAIKEKNIECT